MVLNGPVEDAGVEADDEELKAHFNMLVHFPITGHDTRNDMMSFTSVQEDIDGVQNL